MRVKCLAKEHNTMTQASARFGVQTGASHCVTIIYTNNKFNHKNYNFLACDWFTKVLFSTNSLAKLLSDIEDIT